MSESKVKVIDAAGIERFVRPVDASEIVKAGGSYDLAFMKAEDAVKHTQIIEGVATGRPDSVPHIPTSPDSNREAIDYDLESGDGMPGGKINVEMKGAGLQGGNPTADDDAPTHAGLMKHNKADLIAQAKLKGLDYPTPDDVTKDEIAAAILKAK